MNWNYGNPEVMGNYIVDKGADGISLGWWDGEQWVEMWGGENIKVYGWINVPTHTQNH